MSNEDLIIRYLLDELDNEQREDFEKRLRGSNLMQNELQEYQEVFRTLNAVEEEKRPESLNQRFYAMLDRSMKEDSQAKSAKVFSLWGWQKIAAAAAILILGVFIGQQIKQNPPANNFDTATFTSLLEQDRTSQRIMGIQMADSNEGLDKEVIEVLYDLLLHDPSTNVRLAVVETFAIHLNQENVRQKLLEGIQVINKPVVKIGIIQVLSGSSRNERSTFEKLLENEMDEAVREELHVAIMRS